MALCFFIWVLSSSSGFKPTLEIFHLVVDNLRKLDDFKTMVLLLNELSLRKHCLTWKALAFLAFCSSSSLKDLAWGVKSEGLAEVRGSISWLGFCVEWVVLISQCLFVMGETARKTSSGCSHSMKCGRLVVTWIWTRIIACLEACLNIRGWLKLATWWSLRLSDVRSCRCVHACKASRVDFALEFVNWMLSEGIRPRLTIHAAFREWRMHISMLLRWRRGLSVRQIWTTACLQGVSGHEERW